MYKSVNNKQYFAACLKQSLSNQFIMENTGTRALTMVKKNNIKIMKSLSLHHIF